MALRLATPADEAAVLACCAASAWPEHLPEITDWNHTVWLAYFARPEAIVVVSEVLGKINGVCAFTVTITGYTDKGVAIKSARLVCVPMVSAPIGRLLIAATMLREGLRLCATQGATRCRWAFNPGPIVTALKAAGVTLADRIEDGRTISDDDELLTPLRTKLGLVTG